MFTRAGIDQSRLTTSIPSQRRGKSLAVAGGLALALSGLAGCGGGGTDTPPSSTSTSSTSTSSTSTSTASSSSPKSSAPAHKLLKEFDGWKRGTVGEMQGSESAQFSKGSDAVNIVALDDSTKIDEKELAAMEKFGDISCLTSGASPVCIGNKDGHNIMGTQVSDMTVKEIAAVLTAYLDAM